MSGSAPTKAPARRAPAKPKAVPTRPSLNAIIDVDVKAIIPASDNVRSDLGDLTGLVASIEESGIVAPLRVVPLEGGKSFELVDGHRRFAAAKKAGLKVVPCISEELTDEQRRTIMLVTILHQEDLSPVDKARGFAQLADLGNNQTQVSKLIGVSQATVSKHLAIARLPEKAAKWLSEGKLTVDNAAKISTLPEPARAEMLKRSSAPGSWDINRAQQDADDAKNRDKALRQLEKDGVTILEKRPMRWLDDDKPGTPIELGKYSDMSHVDEGAHKAEPCRAVFVLWNGEVLECCTNPSAHPAPADGEAGDDDSPSLPSQYRPHWDKVEGLMKRMRPLYETAIELSADHVSTVLPHAVRQVLVEEHYYDAGETAIELLEIGPPEEDDEHWRSALARHVEENSSNEAAAITALYALALASGDSFLRSAVDDAVRAGDAVAAGAKINQPDDLHLTEARRHYEHVNSLTEQNVPEIEVLLYPAIAELAAEGAEAQNAGEDDPAEAGDVDEPLEREEDSAETVDDDIGTTPVTVVDSGIVGSDESAPRRPTVKEAIERAKAKQSAQIEAPAEDESVEGQEPPKATITVTEKKGKFWTSCSEHGHIGYNTNEEYAHTKGEIHLKESHADELVSA